MSAILMTSATFISESRGDRDIDRDSDRPHRIGETDRLFILHET